ncbi:MAG: DUF4265 domain-containing protein [bacterium]|nr:DUF4265 domain-containing protein [bacterium]
MKKISIELPVRGGSREVREKLEVEEFGPNHYRLVYTPGLVEGMAAGDEFETINGDLGFRILKRGRNIGVWFFFQSEGENKEAPAQHLTEDIVAIGGRCDGGGFTSLVFSIPVSVGFETLEGVLSRASGNILGSTWMYCNIYDVVDGVTPLGWWLESE